MPAHLKSVILGSELTVPVRDGQLGWEHGRVFIWVNTEIGLLMGRCGHLVREPA